MLLISKKVILILALIGIAAENAIADSFVEADTSPNITLQTLVDKVYQKQPEQRYEQAQQQKIQANTDYANATFAGHSVVSLRHQNDVIGSGDGLQEWEGNLEMPLWLPEQQQQQRILSDSMSAELPAYKAYMRLQASGAVRDAVWHIITTKTVSQQAYQAWQTALKLEKDVETRIDAGEMSASDKLLATAHVYEMNQLFLEKQAEFNYAVSYYHALTGETVLPETHDEPSVEKAQIDSQHPALALLDSSLASLRVQQHISKFDGATNPNLSVGIRREKGANDEDFNNSLGIGISFALENDVYQGPAIAQAAKALADAEIERQQLERQLITTLDQVTHRLEAKQQQLNVVSKQEQATMDYLAVQQRSFELGEIDLVTLIRSQSLANQAHNQKQTLQVEIKQLIAQRNQALGISL